MENDHYTPIECGLHSEYELAIMHKSRIKINWKEPDNSLHTETATPIDLIVKEKQEFLKIKTIDDVIHEIRLDKITQFNLIE